MKKILLALVMFAIILAATSCQKPEEVTISKYFQSMKANDLGTLATMATEPVSLKFKSWKFVSSEAPIIEDVTLPGLMKRKEELDAARKEQLKIVSEKKDAFEEAKGTLGKGKKGAAQQAATDAETVLNAETAKFKALQAEINELKTKIENERNLVKLSTSIERDQEIYEGKAITQKSHTQVTLENGEVKDYTFLLRRYDMTNPMTKKLFNSRFVILKLAPSEEVK